jgi:rubredoxin
MQYETLTLKEHMIPFDVIDFQIDHMLLEKKLTRSTNSFFKMAKSKPYFSPEAAIRIGYNWRAITKEFLFTVLTGLGVFAETLSRYESPPYELMSALQSGVAVISDDLSNVFPTLQEMAPRGPDGAHYKWWEDSVLCVVLSKVEGTEVCVDPSISPGVQTLLAGMKKLSKEALGPAVQMRVVEAIALDIALTDRALFGGLEVKGEKVFPKTEDLAWMNAHIKAEAVHHKMVKDHESGLAYVASSPEEQRKFLVLLKEYMECWAEALEDFAGYVVKPVRLNVAETGSASGIDEVVVVSEKQPFRKWYCVVCDYIYDEELGLPEEGIQPGTYFEAIPADWVCVDCGVSKEHFELILN